MNRYDIVAIDEQFSGDLLAVLKLDADMREKALSVIPAAGAARYIQAANAAIVPIRGVLLDEWSARGPVWGATGYNYIRAAVEEAAADPNVSATVLDISSPGGLVSGMLETFASIEGVGKKKSGKPVCAVIRSVGASAAYALACAADSIIASDSAIVGSIGARISHISLQRAFENAGIKVTDITSHALKADVSPFTDLSPAARERLQSSVDDAAATFVALVARRRNMTVSAVNALEAATFPARSSSGRKTALDLKLVDAVAPADQAIAEILRLSRR